MSDNPNDHAPTTPPPLVDPTAKAPNATGVDSQGPAESATAESGASEPGASESSPVESTSAEPTSAEPVHAEHVHAEPVNAEHVNAEPVNAEPAVAEPAVRESTRVEPAVVEPAVVEPAVVEPAVGKPVAAAQPHQSATDYQPTEQYQPTAQYQSTTPYVVGAPTPPERVFVPPLPVAPKKKGNRGVGSLIAVLAVIVFALVYALVAAAIIAVRAPETSAWQVVSRFLIDPVFYVPAIFFAVGFVIVVLVVNRAGWWAFVIGSIIVGLIVYFGTIGVQLLAVNVVGMTPGEAAARFLAYAANPFVIGAALVARETSLWTGALISSRGRRMKGRNLAAKSEFDRATAEHRAEYERPYSA